MDGAFTAVGAEGNRQLPSGYRLGMLAGSNSAGSVGSKVSAGLFEQILSLPSSSSKHSSQRDQLTKPAGAEVASYASRTEASGEAQTSARTVSPTTNRPRMKLMRKRTRLLPAIQLLLPMRTRSLTRQRKIS
jgi:hypothetical protein